MPGSSRSWGTAGHGGGRLDEGRQLGGGGQQQMWDDCDCCRVELGDLQPANAAGQLFILVVEALAEGDETFWVFRWRGGPC